MTSLLNYTIRQPPAHTTRAIANADSPAKKRVGQFKCDACRWHLGCPCPAKISACLASRADYNNFTRSYACEIEAPLHARLDD